MKTELHRAAVFSLFLVTNRSKSRKSAAGRNMPTPKTYELSKNSEMFAKTKSIGQSHMADDAVIHRSHAIHGTHSATPSQLWALQDLLCQDPEKGVVIQGAGGFRKIRMGLPGRGKCGGCRIIYLHVKSASRIYLVYLYPKNEKVDLSAAQKKALKQIAHAIYEEVKKDPSLK